MVYAVMQYADVTVIYFQNIRFHGTCINLIYKPNKCKAFPALICTKFTNAHQHYMQISCTKFHQTQTITMESINQNSCMPLHKVRLSLWQFPRN
jgi:hypothetical protein